MTPAARPKQAPGHQMRSPTHPSRNRRPPQSRGAKILPSPARIAGIAARAAAERESEGLARVSLRASIPVPQAPLAPSRSKLPLHVRPSQPSGRSLAQLQDGEGRPSRPQHGGASKRGASVAIIGAASLANGPTSLAAGSTAVKALFSVSHFFTNFFHLLQKLMPCYTPHLPLSPTICLTR